jgi:hypothetical protein
MKNLVFTAVLVLSWASASMACSMSCCTGKQKCCCEEQTTSPVAMPNSANIDISGCTCQESAPQPFAEEQVVYIPGNNPSSKQTGAVAEMPHAATQLTDDFSLSIKYSRFKSFHSPAISPPLRI